MNRNIPPALANRGVALKSILFVVGAFFVVALARPEPAYADAVNWNVGVAWTITNLGANELSWRLFECTPPACRNPPNFGSSQQNIQPYTWYATCLDGRYVNTYIEGPFPITPSTQYKITINGQSSMVTPKCLELRGFGQCIVSTEYNGDLGFCAQGKNNGGPVGNSEVVYLSNCSSGGQQSSEMDYYSNSGQSKNGERPAATAQVMQNRYITWEGNKVIGTFPDGNHFTSQITDHNGPVDSVKGSGSNNYHAFTCHQDSPYLLYSAGAQTCTRVYYCVP